MVGHAPDLIVADGNAHVRLLKSAAGTTPIVMANSRDPVAAGLVASLGRPGGNVTGLGNFGVQLIAKQLQLLRESLPRMTRVAVMGNPEYEGAIDQAQLEAAAAPLGLQLHFAAFRNGYEIRAGSRPRSRLGPTPSSC